MGERVKKTAMVWAWSIFTIGTLYWIIQEIRTSSFEAGYWKGRKAGWDSHRRLINTAKVSDEVFDYEKN